jgi:hypothetical protein
VTKPLRWALALLLACAATPSLAADLCEGIATRDVAGDETVGDLKKDQLLRSITEYRVPRKSGVPLYCVHGGNCYPADAIKLTNCKTGAQCKECPSDQYDFYGMDLIRSKIPPELLRKNDLEDRLEDLGLCNPCAAGAADAYLNRPQSKCAQTVRSALEGDPDAAKALGDPQGTSCR